MAGKRRTRVISRVSEGETAGGAKPARGRVAEPAAAAWTSLARVSSTAAKNDFAGVVHRVELGAALVVMRHDRPAVVMIPLEAYESLADVNARRLDALTARFDAELAAMNAPGVWRGTQRGFEARLDQPPVTRRRKGRSRARA